MPNIHKYGKIHYYENVIDNPDDLIEYIEQNNNEDLVISKWEKWESSDNDKFLFGYKKRTSLSNYVKSCTESKIVVDAIYHATKIAREIYTKDNPTDLGEMMPISISKYIEGAYMGAHVDSYDADITPSISMVIYLNDDYEGGEICFKDQGVEIKPSAGSIVVFPSIEPYYHESKPILSGMKYMCPVFWNKL